MKDIASSRRPVKVLLATGGWPGEFCGVSDYASSLTQALSLNPRLEIALLAHRPPAIHAVTGYALANWSYATVPRIWRILREFRPDILHIQYPSRGYKGGLAAKLLPLLGWISGTRVVQTWHEWWKLRQWPDLAIKSLALDGLVYVRNDYLERFNPMFRWTYRSAMKRLIPNASSIPVSTISEDGARALRSKLLNGRERMIVFFGLLSSAKCPELLFDIADAATDQIVFAGQFASSTIAENMQAMASSEKWNGKVTFLTQLEATDAADLLFVADAVVLPFREGAGPWNSSMHAAELQGAFILTTSMSSSGYDVSRNIYFSAGLDVSSMQVALREYAGVKRPRRFGDHAWEEIVRSHADLYMILYAKHIHRLTAEGETPGDQTHVLHPGI